MPTLAYSRESLVLYYPLLGLAAAENALCDAQPLDEPRDPIQRLLGSGSGLGLESGSGSGSGSGLGLGSG